MTSHEMLKEPDTFSRLPQVFEEYQRKLQGIDALERRLESLVSEKRQRALNVLDETPTHRKSHLRLFFTHQYQEESHSPLRPEAKFDLNGNLQQVKKRNKWTLVIEGSLLVENLDCKRVTLQEKEITGAENGTWGHSQTDAKEGVEPTNVPRPSDRQANKSSNDREREEPVTPVKFTHFFERISVSFQSFRRRKIEDDSTLSEEAIIKTSGTIKGQTARTKRSPRRESSLKYGRTSKRNLYETNGKVTNLIWNKEPKAGRSQDAHASDAHAFHSVYVEDQERHGEETSIVVTIQLDKQRSREQKYIPSEKLCTHLFPSLLTDAKKKTEVYGRKWKKTLTKSDPPGLLDSELSIQNDSILPDKQPVTNIPIYDAPPLDNFIHEPNLFTLDEIIDAIFIYAKDRDLFHTTDLSIIRNDSVLENLFDCKEMNVTVCKNLILSKGLLRPIDLGNSELESALECTYIMKKDNASFISSTISSEKANSRSKLDNSTSGFEPILKKRRSVGQEEHPHNSIKAEGSKVLSNILSYDIDIDVPSSLHFRTREILRRIKLREYDHTSSRTKAIRMLQSTGGDEEVVRERLEDIVKGRALIPGNIPLLVALAKAAPPGSEIEREAYIDSRIIMLLDRLEYHSKMAKAYWKIVEKCRGDLESHNS